MGDFSAFDLLIGMADCLNVALRPKRQRDERTDVAGANITVPRGTIANPSLPSSSPAFDFDRRSA